MPRCAPTRDPDPRYAPVDRRQPERAIQPVAYSELIGAQRSRALALAVELARHHRLAEADGGRVQAALSEIFPLLRSPIARRVFSRLVEALVLAIGRGEPLALHAALASPTAEKELQVPLRLAQLLRSHGFDSLPVLHVFEWPSELEAAPTEVTAGRAIAARLEVQARALFPAARVQWIAVGRDMEAAQLNAPPPFATASRAVRLAATSPALAPAGDVQDLRFCEQFFPRQRAFAGFGREQTHLELAYRRGIGRYLMQQSDPDRPAIGLVTELHGRLAHCYELRVPYLNLARVL